MGTVCCLFGWHRFCCKTYGVGAGQVSWVGGSAISRSSLEALCLHFIVQRDAPGTARSVTLFKSDSRHRPPQRTWQQVTKGAWYTETGNVRQPALHSSPETRPGLRLWTAPTRAATVEQPQRALTALEAAAWTAPTRYARQAPRTMRCPAAHARHTRITKHASAIALLSTPGSVTPASASRCPRNTGSQLLQRHAGAMARRGSLQHSARQRGGARR
jgi:hypothetical protein